MKKLYSLTALLSYIAPTLSRDFNAESSSDYSYLENKKITPKVVGGSDASAGNYPWYSAFYQRNVSIDNFYCGGQLVAKKFVLTAAHCKPERGDLVVVGALCPYQSGNCGQSIAYRRVESVFEDPRFKAEITFTLGYDFTMVQLDNDVDDILPVSLDDGSYAPNYMSGKSVWAIGLGLVDVEPPTLASELQHIEISYIPENECREEMKPINLGEFTICASHEPGTGDACNGDSGGPLFDRENQVLVGLTSYGDAECVSTSPGVYARIADNWAWIKSIICGNNVGERPDICFDSPEPFTDSPTTEWCSGGADLDILVATDSWPEQTIWALAELNADEVLVVSSLEDFDADKSHEGNFCLPLDNDQCYSFVIIDLIGDGTDINGDDPDYCISVNGEELECEINFEGNMETVVFPADSCNKSCKPEAFRLKGKTPSVAVTTHMQIQDSAGNLYSVNDYDISIIEPDSDFDYHLDLCAGCYQLVVQDKDSTAFSLFDESGNTVFTQNDFYSGLSSRIDSKQFCVGNESDDGSSSGGSNNGTGDDSSAATFSKAASLFLSMILVANFVI